MFSPSRRTTSALTTPNPARENGKRSKVSLPQTRRAQRTLAASQISPGLVTQLPAAIIPVKFAQAAIALGMFFQHTKAVPWRDRCIYLIQGLLALTEFVFNTLLYVNKAHCDSNNTSSLCTYTSWLALVFTGTLLIGWGISEASRESSAEEASGDFPLNEGSFRRSIVFGNTARNPASPPACPPRHLSPISLTIPRASTPPPGMATHSSEEEMQRTGSTSRTEDLQHAVVVIDQDGPPASIGHH